MPRGKYIVIEGNDGTGKSTQAKMLAHYLQEERGISTYIPEEPGGTPMANAIRSVIKDGSLERQPETNVLLFTAARVEIWKKAQQARELGKWVISARNYYSTLAYQGYGEGVDLNLILRTTQDYIGKEYMNPDHAVILDLSDADERAKRIAGRGMLEVPDTFESKGDTFQDKVNAAYVRIAQQYSLPIINAKQSPEDIHAEIRSRINL